MATYVGGVKDLIPDESYGIAVPPKEPVKTSAKRMQELLLKEARTRLLVLGAHFQERVKKEFSQEKWLQRLAEIYGELNVKFNN
jgi:glycosyltransferase involved in cell wall biosynthesis